MGLGAEHGLRSMDRPRAVFLANLLALVTTLSFAAWLVPMQGTFGAAVSLLAGNVAGCLARWCAFLVLLSERSDRLQHTVDGQTTPEQKSKTKNSQAGVFDG